VLRRVELVSALPLGNGSSFERQLRLLAAAFERKGIRSQLRRPAEAAGNGGGAAPQARIVLGYPDQLVELRAARAFDALRPDGQGRAPLFLWSQLSRPLRQSEREHLADVHPVALTPRTAAHLADLSRDGEEVPVIPHGVDTGLFAPPRPEPEGAARDVPLQTPPPSLPALRERLGLGDAFVVGTVAAHSYRKRFDRIFQSFALFHESLAPLRAQALLVVKTDRVRSIDGRDLERLAEASGIAPWTRFVQGDWSDVDLAALYRCFDLYLNLSEWEGFCIPVAEAMASGVPVVTHDVQGPAEIVPYRDLIVEGSAERRDEGVLLLDADPGEVSSVLGRAFHDPDLRRRLSIAGREASVAKLDINVVAARWIELIERSVAAAPPSVDD